MENEKQSAEGVRAVVRALEILLAFAKGDRELTVTELLARVNLSRPTLYRLIYTLEECGFVTSEGEPQKFRLGPSIGQLSWAWALNLDVARVAKPFMEEIAAKTKETVAVFTPAGTTRTCVAEIPSTQPLSFKRGVGYSEHIMRGATGRALLAWMHLPDSQFEEYCQETGLHSQRLRKELELVRTNGYATSSDELIQGAVAVAVPFFDGGNRIAGSLGIFGPSARLTPARIQEIAPLLIEAAQKISSALGRSEA
jgi:DNA-binding IclR family transcriptional regulator